MRPSIEVAKKIAAMVIGTVQTTLGGLAVVFAYFLHINFLGLQENLNVLEFVPLFMLILIIFGLFSVISGLYLLAEREKSAQEEDYST